jgi:hypothetical protein
LLTSHDPIDEDDDGIRFIIKVAELMASNDGLLMTEAMLPMLLVNFLKSGWLLIAKAQFTLITVRLERVFAKRRGRCNLVLGRKPCN